MEHPAELWWIVSGITMLEISLQIVYTAKCLSRSSVLFLLPFFILDILGCLEVILLFESACCCCCCCCAVANTETIKKLVSKLDLLFFTGNKDRSGTQKILCLESAKLFLGYGPQLCFQTWVLEASLSPSFTQYLSIVTSFVLATKSAYLLLTYSRENLGQATEDSKEKSCKEKLSHYLNVLMRSLPWLPLIWTSLLFKMGSIILYVKFFGWFSIGVILALFLLHAVGGVIINRCLGGVTLNPRLSSWTEGLPLSGRKVFFSHLDNLFISFSNLFVISRPFNTLRYVFTKLDI